MKKHHQGYLQDMLARIERIERYSVAGRSAFLADTLIQDAIIRNFEVIGEIVKRLDPNFIAQHADLPWRRIAGFRDVLIHDYEIVRVEIIWEVIEKDLAGLKLALLAILAEEPPTSS